MMKTKLGGIAALSPRTEFGIRDCSKAARQHARFQDDLVGGPRGGGVADQMDLADGAELVIQLVSRHATKQCDDERVDLLARDIDPREDVPQTDLSAIGVAHLVVR